MTPKAQPFDLETFAFNGHQLRTVMIDGKPWFLIKDVLSAIGGNPRSTQHVRISVDVAEYLVLTKEEAAETGIELRDLFASGGRGGARHISLVSESGLYKFTLRAQRSNPAAKEVQDWVTKEVLPRIRRDGAYFRGEENKPRIRSPYGDHALPHGFSL